MPTVGRLTQDGPFLIIWKRNPPQKDQRSIGGFPPDYPNPTQRIGSGWSQSSEKDAPRVPLLFARDLTARELGDYAERDPITELGELRRIIWAKAFFWPTLARARCVQALRDVDLKRFAVDLSGLIVEEANEALGRAHLHLVRQIGDGRYAGGRQARKDRLPEKAALDVALAWVDALADLNEVLLLTQVERILEAEQRSAR